MGVEPKIGVVFPPKWMVKIMENPIKMDDLGVPLFLETPIYRFLGGGKVDMKTVTLNTITHQNHRFVSSKFSCRKLQEICKTLFEKSSLLLMEEMLHHLGYIKFGK